MASRKKENCLICILIHFFRFDFSDINNKSGQDRIIKEEEEDKIVTSLHTILKPFLLRRLKTDGKQVVCHILDLTLYCS